MCVKIKCTLITQKDYKIEEDLYENFSMHGWVKA